MSSTSARLTTAPRAAALVGAVIAALAVVPAAIPGPASTSGFWSTVTALSAVEAERYESLKSMVANADAVVVGEITEVAEGRVFGDPVGGDGAIYVEAQLKVDQVFSGSIEPGAVLPLEFFVPGVEALEAALIRPTPNAGLFILRNKGVEARTLGYSSEYQAAEAPYYRLMTFAGFVANESGTARVSAASDDYLLVYYGAPFTELVDEVKRSLAG